MDKISTKKTKSQSGEGGGATPPPRAGAGLVLPGDIQPSPTKEALGRSYGCAWTLYDYEKYIGPLREYAKQTTYMVYGYETCPDTGRPHLQGYVHWANKRSLGAFSETFGNCHVEKPKGSAEQNRAYCLKIRPQDQKPNERYEEYGTLPQQGKRVDWEQAISDIKSGKDITDVIDDQPHLLPNQRALREYKNLLLKPKHREVHVITLIGDSGSGKSRYAYDHYPDLYSKPRGDWWDGYTGQTTILLDDYYGYLPYCELLRVLDRYPYQVPVKGGFVQAQWDTVIITSNKMPQQWYQQGLTPALRRRLKKVIYYRSIDGETTQEEISLEEARISEA